MSIVEKNKIFYGVVEKKQLLGIFDNDEEAKDYIRRYKPKAKMVPRIVNRPIIT